MSTKRTPQLIGSYQHLPHHPRPQHALHLLRKTASLVKPIMVKHGFHIGTLAEFYPDEHNLLGLNINGGQQILLRLRAPYDPATFLSEDGILETMLHELCHNVHGPHAERFYALLAELEREYIDLRKKGWRGEGFYSEGNRLGGRPAPGIAGAGRMARDWGVAEGGHRLGGGRRGPESDGARRERLAAAAERRVRDKERCGEGRGVEGEGTKAGREGVTTKYDEAAEDAELAAALQQIAEMELAAARRDEEVVVTGEGWVCGACTFVNYPLMDRCEMCETSKPTENPPPQLLPRPAVKIRPTQATNGGISAASRAILAMPEKEEKVWICHKCTLVNEEMFWTCHGCGAMKLVS